MIPVLVALFAFFSQVTDAAYCGGSPDAGERTSQYPIFDEAPTFVRQVKNGMLFEAGPANARFPVVHLWGNAYEVGYAQGQLMKDEVTNFVRKTNTYLIEEIVSSLGDHFPDAAKALVIEIGMEKALAKTAEWTAPFTSQPFYDEVRGLADATGLNYDMLYNLQMFPELTKAQCSFFGAWGTAVKNEGYTYQLRSLDFDTEGPFKEYNQITVYHPTDGGHPYAQVSWPGNVGSLSGMSSAQIAISEIGVAFPDESFQQGKSLGREFPPEKVKGQPWMYILRDVLQYADSLEDARNTVANANRTCNLIIGLGDGEEAHVNGVEFSGYVANFYDDKNQLPVNDTWHPVVEDAVYNGMDWLCPGYTQKLGEQLQKWHGQIDENVIIHDILPTVQSGNLHSVVYDLHESNMHISFCRKSEANPSEPFNAYERQFTRLHMNDLFALQAPVF
jgi:isopenicillin-N N-acyltransferase-like protein